MNPILIRRLLLLLIFVSVLIPAAIRASQLRADKKLAFSALTVGLIAIIPVHLVGVASDHASVQDILLSRVSPGFFSELYLGFGYAMVCCSVLIFIRSWQRK